MKVYKDILKELEKGNAVFVDVRSKDNLEGDRFRILYGTKSYFDFLDMYGYPYTQRSCFCLGRAPSNSLQLVTRMEKYDLYNGLRIKKYTVL